MWRTFGIANLALILMGVMFMSVSAVAEPVLPPAKGDACVEPVDEMRRYHMVYLKHMRDETMHGGIRGEKHSLVGCADCHTAPVTDTGGTEVQSLEPFCSSCHEYTAVTIDCFGCHSPKSGGAEAKGN